MPNADPYLLPMAGLLTAIGVTEIYRLGNADAFRQGLWIVIGVGLYALALWGLRRDYRVLEQYKYLFGIGAIALLFLPRVPGLGTTVNGARLWVHVGSFRFQPGEFSKIFLIVFLAAYLREKRESLAQARLKDVGPLLVIWGACMLVLVSSNDLGSGLLYFGIFLSMLYVATARLSFVVVGMGLFLAAESSPTRTCARSRASHDLAAPWTDEGVLPDDRRLALRQDCESYQLVKSPYSIRNGGFGGTGLGRAPSRRRRHAADPVREQRLHLLGAGAGARADRRRGPAARLHALRRAGDEDRATGRRRILEAARRGLTFGFALQTFIIVGGVLRIIPLTGITLPFVSYGGSSIVANFFAARRAAARLEPGQHAENRQISRIAIVALLLLASLVVATTYWQTWAPGSLAANQDNAIQRVAQFAYQRAG